MHATRAGWVVIAVALVALLPWQAYAACSFGDNSLQSMFDSTLGTGSLSAAGDCLPASSDGLWSSQGRAAATIVAQSTGESGSDFGIYDPRRPKYRISIFDGSASEGSESNIQLRKNGKTYNVFANDSFKGRFKSSTFGFYLRTASGQTFFSEARRNRDRADHMYAFAGNGDRFGNGPLDGAVFAKSMYLLAFEDSRLCRTGKKARIGCGVGSFQDFVVTVNSIAPIPLPAGAPLLGVALVALTIWRRRGVVHST